MIDVGSPVSPCSVKGTPNTIGNIRKAHDACLLGLPPSAIHVGECEFSTADRQLSLCERGMAIHGVTRLTHIRPVSTHDMSCIWHL